MAFRPKVPREHVLFGKSYHKGVPASHANVQPVTDIIQADRLDVRDVSLIVMEGVEYIRVTLVAYRKKEPEPVVHDPKST